MVKKSTKRLSVFFSAVALTSTLLGIPQIAEAKLIGSIFVPLVVQALGYALPRIVEHEWKSLTPQERQEINAIRKETIKQLENVLTKEQRTKISQSFRSRQGLTTAIKSLRLTPQQRARIQAIIKTSRQQMQEIISERKG